MATYQAKAGGTISPEGAKPSKEIIIGLFALYGGCILFASWWPFHFQLHPSVATKVEWPLLEFLAPNYWRNGKPVLLKVVTFIPVGIFFTLLARITQVHSTKLTLVKGTVLTATCLSLLIQTGWFFLPGRLVSATNIILSVMGALAGTTLIFIPLFSRKTLVALIALYCACFLVAATWPWDFSLRHLSLSAAARRIEWLPFNGYLFRTWVMKEAVLNSLMTVPLGLLAASYVFRGGGDRRAAIWAAIVIGGSSSFFVEFVQYFLPVRTPSFGDVMVNTTGAFAGGLLASYLARWHKNGSKAEQINPAEVARETL